MVKAAKQYLDFDINEEISGKEQGKGKPTSLTSCFSPVTLRTISMHMKERQYCINYNHNLLKS